MKRIAAVLLAAPFLMGVADGADYGSPEFLPSPAAPINFRGDPRGGFPGASVPAKFSERENLRWKAAVGQGCGAVIVVGSPSTGATETAHGRVFVQAAPNALVCVEAASGKTLWRRTHHAGTLDPKSKEAIFDSCMDELGEYHRLAQESARLPPDRRAQHTNAMAKIAAGFPEPWGARGAVEPPLLGQIPGAGIGQYCYGGIYLICTTPCSDGKRVVARFPTGIVVAYDLDGVHQWSAGTRLSGERPACLKGASGNWPPQPSQSACPVLTPEGVVVVHMPLVLFGLDAETGKERWRVFDANIHGTFASPVVGRIGGESFVATGDGAIVRARDGLLVHTDAKGTDAPTCPVFDGGVFYWVTHAVRIVPGEPPRAEVLWDWGNEHMKHVYAVPYGAPRQSSNCHMTSPVLIHGKLLYFGQAWGNLMGVIDPYTGLVEATIPIRGEMGVRRLSSGVGKDWTYSGMMQAGDRLVMAHDHGMFHVVAANDSFAPLRSNALPDDIYAHPVAHGSSLYVRTLNALWRFDDPDAEAFAAAELGQSRGWRGDGSGADGGPAPVPFSIERQRRWTASLPAGGTSEPVALGKRILVADRAGLTCLDTDGRTLWRRTPDRVPAVPDERAGTPDPTPVLTPHGWSYAVFADGTVMACDTQGVKRWEAAVPVAPDRPAVSPLPVQWRLVVQGAELVCFDHGGTVKWRKPTPKPSGSRPWGPPAKASFLGKAAVVTAWGALIRLEDGNETPAGLRLPPEGATPTVERERVYWAGGDGAKGRVVAARLPTRKGQRPSQRWERDLARPAVCAAVARDGFLTVLDSGGNLVTLAAEDGAVVSTNGVADAADARAELLAAGGRILVSGLPGRSLAVAAGRDPGDAWEFRHEGRAFACVADERLYVRAGDRLHCIGAARRPLETVEIPASAAITDVPSGLPAWDLVLDDMTTNWLAAGPLPGRNLQDDPLAGRGGRAAVPRPGDEIRLAGDRAAFFATDTNHVFVYRTNTMDVTAIHRRTWDTTGMMALAVRNDKDRFVRFTTLPGGGWHNRARLELRAFLGGVEIGETTLVRLPAGAFVLLLQTSMGDCDPWGKIFIRPRFLDADEDWRRNLAVEGERRLAAADAMRRQTFEP